MGCIGLRPEFEGFDAVAKLQVLENRSQTLPSTLCFHRANTAMMNYLHTIWKVKADLTPLAIKQVSWHVASVEFVNCQDAA